MKNNLNVKTSGRGFAITRLFDAPNELVRRILANDYPL